MIHDLLHDIPGSERRQVCIVGAGAAGIALAVELERLGRSVLLLEGGGAQFERNAQEPYLSELAGLPHQGVHAGRFRVHGGTTTRWGGQILEFDEIDFEQRAWVPESGWPFPKRHLASFYKRAIELEGLRGALQQDADIWKALGCETPSFPGLESYCSRWCPEPNFARLHRKRIEGPGIDVWLHANAVELLLENDTVRGLRCRTQTGIEAVFKADDFVFCVGAIESARFFLQPRRDGSALPWNRFGLVGKYFQDHIDCNGAEVRPRSTAAFHAAFDDIYLNGYKYSPKIRLPAESEQSSQVLNAAAFMYSPGDSFDELAAIKEAASEAARGNLGKLHPKLAWHALRHAPLLLRKAYRYALQHRAYKPDSAKINLRVHCEQAPDSQSSVSLSGERDSLGMLRTRLDWKIAPVEVRTIRRFVEVAQVALKELADIVPNPALASNDDSILRDCDDSYHHMGGMRMSASPSNGVVNTDLKLNGTRNCFICSSAVFPASGFSNPTHTLIALSVRLAQHLTSAGPPELRKAALSTADIDAVPRVGG